MNTRALGAYGEELACRYLEKNGCEIAARNFHASRAAELDIVAKEKNLLLFVEVKTRFSPAAGSGREAVTIAKQRHIRYAAQYYMMRNRLTDIPCRFDVLEISLWGDAPEIVWLKNAF
ncbi:MAG: YraN family protein [Clostridia bacterium]|nr:YraN family protein [Clostridia bacterium]